MKRAALLLCLALPIAAFACEEPQTEVELQDTYTRASHALGFERRALLEDAQRVWHEFREANCAVFAYRGMDGPGSDAHQQCLAFMARERNFELELLIYTADPEELEGPGC